MTARRKDYHEKVYVRKSFEVAVIQYQDSSLSLLKVISFLRNKGAFLGDHSLSYVNVEIPATATTERLHFGDWLVWELDKLLVMSDKDFNDRYAKPARRLEWRNT